MPIVWTMVIWVLLAAPVCAFEVTDRLALNGVLYAAYQYQWTDGDEDGGRGALPFHLEMDFQLSDQDELSALLGFAAGNGLNDVTAFSLAPWSADMEDDVKDINGRGRDYLLTAWYKHTFDLGNLNTLGITGGIIDSTVYLNANAFANDQYTQFMNEALANPSTFFLPTYDIGGAVEWEVGNLDLSVVGMDVGQNEDGKGYRFFGGQIGYRLETPFGQGHYRLVAAGTSKDFLDEDGNAERLRGIILSCDQELGDIYGVWIRLAWQEASAAMPHNTLFSGGVNIIGQWYGRPQDNIGIGYAYLNGANGLDATQVAEIYWRVALNAHLALTADLQYMADRYDDPLREDIEGVIAGVRVAVEL